MFEKYQALSEHSEPTLCKGDGPGCCSVPGLTLCHAPQDISDIVEKQELVEKAKQEAAKGPKGKAPSYPVPLDYTHDSATGGAQLYSNSWWLCSQVLQYDTFMLQGTT